MKKHLIRTISTLLTVVLLLTAAPLNGFVGLDFGLTAEAATITSYSTGDIIEFGWYPQSEVTDADTIAVLNAAGGEWISYNYYSGTGNTSDGKMTASDYMRYKDVLYNDNKYRGVVFDAYRPNYTGYTSSSSYAKQDDNGYNTNIVYWFQYEPIQWRVLDPARGMVISETILDSQAYNNYVLSSGTDEYGYTAYWGDAAKTHYANNYGKSSIREWLNSDFYNTAFSSPQQNIIATKTLDNSAYSDSCSAYDSATTNDKIYLLSYDDARNTVYGFSDNTARTAQGSAYAKSQGLYVYSSNCAWFLRSAGNDSLYCCGVRNNGHVSYYESSALSTDRGVRPAFNFNLSSAIFQSDVKELDTAGGASVNIASGTCGNNLTWTLDDSGTLTISGTGAMTDYSSSSSVSWYSYRSSVKTVVISDSVTTIGDYAFCLCSSLTSVTTPDSVTSIGDHAFDFCGSLTSITIPNSVTSIGDHAFDFCGSLTSITVDANNTSYSSDKNGVLFNKKKTTLIQYPIGNPRTSYTIPDSVISIGNSAFEFCDSLTSVTIGNSVTTIGASAFYSCDSLTSVTIGNSVTTIGDAAFCWCGSLTSVTIGNSVTTIGDSAFEFCDSLTSVTIGNSVTTIGDSAFRYCDSLTDVYYAGSEERWKKISIGSYNTALTNATIHYNYSNPGENQKAIAVFTTEKSLSLTVGDSMWLAFALIDKELNTANEWNKMAIVVSDPTVITLSDYEITDYGYSLEVIGQKEGSTNVTITDTESGISTIIAITVCDSFVQTSSYAIDSMKVFYPNNKFEDHIATNIYNLNGLYVNNYQCIKNGDTYNIDFDVYNSKYYAGAVDIYDQNGMWIGYEEINKHSDISSLWDTIQHTYYLITNTAKALNSVANDSNLLTYEQESFSKHTHISLKLKDGEYFTISNNIGASPGVFFINAFEIIFDAAYAILDFVTSDSVKTTALSGFKKNAAKSFADRLIEARNEGLKNELKKKAQKVMLGTMQSEINKITKNFVNAEIMDKLVMTDDICSAMATLAENILCSFNINWKHLFQSAVGITESAFSTFAGPAGVALKGCFAITKSTNKILMATQMSMSTNKTYVSVYSKIDEGLINPHGVVVNTNGNIDAESVLQVFRVSDDNTIKVLLDSDNPLQAYELYNICFTKNDSYVQPNGKVKVHIPIPAGMNGQTCNVYRQETNGAWTILNAHVEGNYLVFETDHFSLYAIIGDKAELTVEQLPNQIVYPNNSVLNLDGLVLSLNGESITEGYVCSPMILSTNSSNIITVQYGQLKTEFVVTIVDQYLGDVNGDGVVSSTDARTALRAAVGLDVLSEAQKNAADVNKDGKITSSDARSILRCAVGLETFD